MNPSLPDNDTDGGNCAAARVGLVRATLAVTFAIVAVASFMPAARLWGFNHLAFYPLGIRIAVLALVAVCFIPAFAHYLFRFFLSIPEDLEKMARSRSTLLIIGFVIVMIAMFWTFRSSTNLLGDGQLIEGSFNLADHPAVKVIMRSPLSIMKEENVAPGVTLFYFFAAEISKALGNTPGGGIRFLNCIFGGLFVLILLFLIRDGPFSLHNKVWILILTILGSTVQLFFGYMENYAIPVFFLALYVITCLRSLNGTGSIAWPIILFLISLYAHVQGFLFFTSLVFVVLRVKSSGRGRAIISSNGVTILTLLTLITIALAWTMTNLGDYFLPLRANAGSYGMFSPTHFLDVANELMMLLPLLPVIIVMGLLGRRLTPVQGVAGNKAHSWFASPAEWQFVLLMLVPCGLYLFLFHPEIGMARDWDLFAMISVALVPLSLLIVNRYALRSGMSERTFASFTAPSLALTIALSVSWYGINANPLRTADRFEQILSYDRSLVAYAYENLAVFYEERGDINRAIGIMEMTTELSRNPRQYVRLATYYEQIGERDRSIELMYDVLDRHPDFHKARYKLAVALNNAGRWENLVQVSRGGTEYHPEVPLYYFYLGESLIQTGQPDEGLAWLRKCRSLNPPKGAIEHINERLKEFGQQ